MAWRQKSVAVQSNIDGLLLDKAVEFFSEECEKRWVELASSVSPRSVGRAFKRLADDLEFVERQAQGEDASSAPTKVRKVARLSALMEEKVASLREEYETQLQELRTENTELRRAMEEAAQDAANAQEVSARQLSEVRSRNVALAEQLSRWCTDNRELASSVGNAAAIERTNAITLSGVPSTGSSAAVEASGQAFTLETKIQLLQHAHATQLNELQSQNAQLSERLETKDLLLRKKDQLLAQRTSCSIAVGQEHHVASAHVPQETGSNLAAAPERESANEVMVDREDESEADREELLSMKKDPLLKLCAKSGIDPMANEVMVDRLSLKQASASGLQAELMELRTQCSSQADNAAMLSAQVRFAEENRQDRGCSTFAAGLTNKLLDTFSARAAQCSGQQVQSYSTSAHAISAQDPSSSVLVAGSTHESICTDFPRVEPSKGQESHLETAVSNSELTQPCHHVPSTSSVGAESGKIELSKGREPQLQSGMAQASIQRQASPSRAHDKQQRKEEEPLKQSVPPGGMNQATSTSPSGTILQHAPVDRARCASPFDLCAQLKLWSPAHCESHEAQQAQALEMIDALKAKLHEVSAFVQKSGAQEDDYMRAKGAAPPLLAVDRVSPRGDVEISPRPAVSSGRQDPEGESLPKNSKAGILCKSERSVCERGQVAGKGRPPRPSLMLAPLASGCSGRELMQEAAVRPSQRGRSFDRCFASEYDCEDISMCSTRSGVSSASSGSEGGCNYSTSRCKRVGSSPPFLPPILARPADHGKVDCDAEDAMSDSEAVSSRALIKRNLSWVQGWQPQLASAASVRQRSAGPDLEQVFSSERPPPLRCPPASARSSSSRVLVRIVSEAGIRCHGDDLKIPPAPELRSGHSISS